MAAASVVHAAARNNAEWCDALCRTHGITAHFDADSWTSPKRTPPFYPDAVTLDAGVLPAQLLAKIDRRAGCSVKDSFADLELDNEGFRVLFRGEWLLDKREDGLQLPSRWWVVETREQLADWESAWNVSGSTSSLFRPSLLASSAIAVLAQDDGKWIVGGAVVNRSATVIGLSNVFHRHGDLESVWRGAASAAHTRWGPMPVVGYDSGTALDAAHRAGFGTVGELVVWVKKPAVT
jgi:hypothetical protein